MSYKVTIKQRGAVWYAYYQEHGKRQVQSLGTRDKAAAEEHADAIRARINSGGAGASITMADYLPVYLKARLDKIGEFRQGAEWRVEKIFKLAILPTFGHRALADITEADVQAWKLARLDGRAVTTVRCEMTYLRALLRNAHRENVIASDPTASVNLPQVDPIEVEAADVRQKVLTAKEIRKLIRNARKYKHVWQLAVNTGLRRQELLNIQIDRDVDIEARMLTVRSTKERPTKSRKSRTIPLNDAALEAVQTLIIIARRKQHGAYLLKQCDVSSVTRAFKTDARRAGVNNCATLHWLRHTFASAFVNNPNNNIVTAKELLGHADLATTANYLHSREQDKVAGVNSLKF